jgi:hypothetical protein
MPDRRTLLLNFVHETIQKLQDLNGLFVDGDEDTADDLDNAELEKLIDQLQEKSNRPRRIIGAI